MDVSNEKMRFLVTDQDDPTPVLPQPSPHISSVVSAPDDILLIFPRILGARHSSCVLLSFLFLFLFPFRPGDFFFLSGQYGCQCPVGLAFALPVSIFFSFLLIFHSFKAWYDLFFPLAPFWGLKKKRRRPGLRSVKLRKILLFFFFPFPLPLNDFRYSIMGTVLSLS